MKKMKGDEVEVIAEALNRAKLPRKPKTVQLRYRLRTEWGGDEAIWVYVILDDASVREPYWPRLARIEEAITNALDDAGIARSSHVRFRTKSEQDVMDRPPDARSERF